MTVAAFTIFFNTVTTFGLGLAGGVIIAVGIRAVHRAVVVVVDLVGAIGLGIAAGAVGSRSTVSVGAVDLAIAIVINFIFAVTLRTDSAVVLQLIIRTGGNVKGDENQCDEEIKLFHDKPPKNLSP